MKYLKRSFVNLLGWRTNRKIIVFESDDWGSLRINSKKTLQMLIKKSVLIENDPYSAYDTLETYFDMIALYEVLEKYKDIYNNPPCITTNTLLANPDFHKIKESYFQEYYYICLTESYEKYSDGRKVIDMIQKGLSEKFIYPQFHGREHLNVPLWLRELRTGNKNLLNAFELNVFAVPSSKKINSKTNPTAAFDSVEKNDILFFKHSIVNGVNLFNDFFKYFPLTIIAPSYTWSNAIEEISNNNGIEGFQGITFQFIPKTNGRLSKKFHYTGQKNKFGQYYLVRNAFFEPSLLPERDWVSDCLSRIDLAFKFNKPAIIGTHRVNFIGEIEEQNRTNNLKLFDELLKRVLKKWPDVEFSNSCKLLNEIQYRY